MTKTLLTTSALVALFAAGPAFAQSDTAPAADEPPAATEEMAPDPGLAEQPPAATDEVAPDATVPEVAPDQELGETETLPAEPDSDTTATEEGTEVPDTAVAGELFIGEQAEGEHLASNWIGQRVYNANEENLGSINDLLFNADGSLKAAILGVGGFLGIGEKEVAVSFDAIEPRTEEDGDVTLYLDTTQEALEAAPDFMTLADIEAERLRNQPPVDPMADPSLQPAPAPAP
jgi:hypothetical protein